ncbi:plasmid partitioning protein ParB [Opitutaceae bacterium TAV5]|nr:plasmid partitioning protein ParB [Opitutaceae bacterium TAV5]
MTTAPLKIDYLATASLIPYARNAKLHSDAQVAQIAGAIKEFGFNNPVLIDDEGVIVAGHGRVLAAQSLGLEQVPCVRLSHLTEAQRKAYRIADNRLAEIGGGWNEELLRIELEELAERFDFDTGLTGFTAADIAALASGADTPQGSGALSERFGAPPFSVFDARAGWWQDRKNEWLAYGLASEEGRSDSLIFESETAKNFGRMHGGNAPKGTSIFDPVLCELLYTWFCAAGGVVLDPFAGGSVRGVVASELGRHYVGVDLRSEQVEANRAQAEILCKPPHPAPVWHVGDSRNIAHLASDVRADFLFSCPPYADLEVYSDDPADLSTMEYSQFITCYREIISASAALLRNDRFACFVVGDIRDPATGLYRNFVADTIAAFHAAGLALYNEAVLVTMAGSLPLRINKQFTVARKLGKTHQNVLVFVKGDPRRAAASCGDIQPWEGRADE